MVVLLGWNEKRAVCDAKAIAQGKREAVEVGCGSASEGDAELVLFACDLSQEGLQPFTQVGAFTQPLSGYTGTGLKISSEMYQCKETVHSETTKDKVGGGKTTIKTYTYSREWSSTYINSGNFEKKSSTNFQQNCGYENPQWPADVPESGSLLASRVKVGAFYIEKSHIEEIPLETPVPLSSLPGGWTGTAAPYYRSQSTQQQVGDMRISFFGTNWANPAVTVLGENSGGTIKKWVADDTWLCSGYTLSDLKPGTMSKDAMFKALEEEARALTWILRVVGFIIGWVAFCCLAGPLEVAADCVPCIGPFLGDSLMCVASCVACLPATACCIAVIGIVWIVMRPMVGGALLAVFACIFAGLIGFKCYAQQSGMSRGGYEPDPEKLGAESGNTE